MAEGKFAVIGDKDSVMLFTAVGIDVYAAETPDVIEKTLHRLAREGYAVIFITEKAAALALEAVDRYKTETYPAIIPIPDRNGSTGLGLTRISKDVEKAIGADILFQEER